MGQIEEVSQRLSFGRFAFNSGNVCMLPSQPVWVRRGGAGRVRRPSAFPPLPASCCTAANWCFGAGKGHRGLRRARIILNPHSQWKSWLFPTQRAGNHLGFSDGGDSPTVSAPNFSTRYCALHPTAHINSYRQAMACPRAAQKTATYRSLRSAQWQRWCRRPVQ